MFAFVSLFAITHSAQNPIFDLKQFAPYTASAGDGDYTVTSTYRDAPEITKRAGVPEGKVYHFTMDSHDSLRFPGIAKDQPLKIVPYTRNVTVYVPANTDSSKPMPFFVAQDSLGSREVPTVLDNLIFDKRVPSQVAIFINSGGSDAQGSERGLEYDTLSGGYAEFIEYEVLPRVSKECSVTLTKDPDARMTMGSSSGAACAFSMAWYHNDWYHRVVSYSGTYVNQQWPPMADNPHGAWEYHATLIPQSKKKNIRIWMEVGENDIRATDPESTYHNWVMANQRMAAALKSKGYKYQYVFAQGAGHSDGRAFRETIAQALEYVWKGYRSR